MTETFLGGVPVTVNAERNPEVSILFEEFNQAVKDKDFEKAEDVLDQIDVIRDFHDNQVTVNRVKLKLERIRGGKN